MPAAVGPARRPLGALTGLAVATHHPARRRVCRVGCTEAGRCAVTDPSAGTHTAIVTGANHGIGAATAVALARRGCAVLCTFLRVEDPDDPGTPGPTVNAVAGTPGP